MTNEDYIAGVLALQNSLDRVGSKYPLVVMAPVSKLSEKTIELFKFKRISLHDIKEVHPRLGVKTSYAFEQFSEIWSKLRAWELTQYDLVTFLDADIIVLKNMDHIFDLMYFDEFAASFACICNPRGFSHYPAHWKPENCAYTQCKSNTSLHWCHDHQYHQNDERSMPDKEESRYFNSGMFVFRPSLERAKEILTHFESFQDLTSFQFADQDFLNLFFKGKWRPLSYVYNGLKTLPLAHLEMWNLSQVYTIHYIIDKPWMMPMSERPKDDPYYNLYQIWWNIFENIH